MSLYYLYISHRAVSFPKYSARRYTWTE